MNAYTLEEVEQKIHDTYQFFATVAPGVQPREEGELGVLWALFDDMVGAES